MGNSLSRFLLNKQDPSAAAGRVAAAKLIADGVTPPAGAGDVPVEAPVGAPAFSITKVLTSGSLVIAPVAALLVEWLGGDKVDLRATHYVVLIVALLAFLAIVSSSDVLARSIAARAAASTVNAKLQTEALKANVKATTEASTAAAKLVSEDSRIRRDSENLLLFPKPFIGSYLKESESADDPDEIVEVLVLAATGGATTFYLTKEGDKLRWMLADSVTLSAPPAP